MGQGGVTISSRENISSWDGLLAISRGMVLVNYRTCAPAASLDSQHGQHGLGNSELDAQWSP